MLIGEVARRSGVSARMLRHYESLGLVRPTGRTVGGYREYAEPDIQRIFHVESLRTLGLSLRQIGQVLDDPGFAPTDLIGDLIRETERRLARERELLKRLRAVDASEPAGWEAVLRIVELLRGLASPSAATRQQTVLAPESDMPAPVLAEAVLTETDPHVAGALRWALARAGADVAANLEPGLTSDDPDVRRRAVQMLTEIPGDDAADLLTNALADPDPHVRARAALALGTRRRPEAAPVLVNMIVTGTNDVEASEVLGTLAADPELAAPIEAALAAELEAPAADHPVRMRLVQALAELPDAFALPLLHGLTADADRTLARTAAALAALIEDRAEGGA
ncbi:HEAT repeat domain-containing protein [Glycomyces algeriensis]|uniref:MerR family transcriptional regulator n=1 Tax=Glycomyces algeriensis TaxID=256037 RepID=A0A9W6GDJ6_9ACTN|nr:HEAT repeat domain-containing protein [Glycomyces algeriensis]MDA1366388.1 HEAT repeat domain-containing protein [Glycomyces algeriensis]MDR7352046.1 DNA-binding transcriptional MerR regulator [Glycomyces algeriensis]GLI44778.1 MerR family transcriptional regulator [Glycomyces algeriensis]